MKPAIYMFMSALFFATMGAIVKVLSHFPFYQLVLFRSLIILALCIPHIMALKVNLFGKAENRKILILRGIFGTAGLTLYFWTLQQLDFGTAVTIQYTSPLFTVFIATYILGEQKSTGTLSWMMIALLGVATIYRFDFGGEQWGIVLLGLAAAIFAGCAYNCISLLKDKENSQVIMMYFPLVTIPMVAIPSTLEFVPLGINEGILITAMGISTYFAQFFLTRAYQMAPASQVAVYGNLNVIMALIVGWVVFHETPDTYKLLGSGLILLSVFSVQRLQNAALKPPKVKKLADSR